MLLQIILCICAALGHSLKFDYEDFKVYRTYPKTEKQNEFMKSLVMTDERLDFWTDVNNAGIPVDVMVNPEDQEKFLDKLKGYDIVSEVFIDNVQERIDGIKVQDLSRQGFTWTSYYKLEDIHAWMDSLPQIYHDKVTVVSAGKSYEKRDIKGVRVSHKNNTQIVFIECGIHAREWISPATCTYLINELLTSTDPEFRRIADSFQWYVFPSVNPDGYAYTHKRDRLWRKTRKPSNLFCTGVDPNRNWDFHFNEAGTSRFTCHQTYAGTKAFSEDETLSLSNYITSLAKDIKVYLAIHSYSQLILLPYGHTKDHLDNHDDALRIGKKAAEALAVRYGTNYTVGNTAETICMLFGCDHVLQLNILDKASGTSADWVKGIHKVPIVYTYELRDKGKNGFVLPADQIIPNSEEIMDSLVAMFKEAKNLNYVQID